MSGLPFRRVSPSPAEARAALHTVRDLVRHAVSRLVATGAALGHGTDDPWDEAAWLVLWSLHLPLERFEPVLDARLTPCEVGAVIELIERRCAERLPAAYLTGEAWLRGVRFLCDPRALVPRSPIAELLDSDALAPWLPEGLEVGRVMDLCTGGGSLAILAARPAKAGRRFDGFVALGCVIRGETTHYDIVAGESSRALMDLAVARRLPIGNGILTVEDEAQAWRRARR
jgi:hypothetical protein